MRSRPSVRSRRPFPMAALLVVASGLGSTGLGAQTPAATSAPGLELPVVDRTLDNGLRVLVLPRPEIPTAAFVLEVAVGSVQERTGATGIAHLLEHLLFKGSTTVGTRDVEAERALFPRIDLLFDSIRSELARPAPDSARVRALRTGIRTLEGIARPRGLDGEFDRILSRNGARGLNATTSADATTYYVELPANRAKLWFVLEADRLMNPVLRDFHAERDVVLEERRYRVESSPGGLLHEAHLAAAFQAHPYGVPVIGHRSDLEALSRAEVEEFLRTHYVPSNMTLAVVGAIEADSILAWADDYLGRIPAGPPSPPVRTREPEQRGERRVRVEYDAEPLLRMGWHTVSQDHPDAPALTMLTSLLVGGRGSRLHRRLVLRERMAGWVTASMEPGMLHPAQFVIEAAPRSPWTPEEVESAILEELSRIAREPPTPAEVDRVRNQIEGGRVRRLQSNLGLAFQLASSGSRGRDWRETFLFAEAVRGVTPGEIRDVVRRWFRPERRTVGILVRPEPPPPPASPMGRSDGPDPRSGPPPIDPDGPVPEIRP